MANDATVTVTVVTSTHARPDLLRHTVACVLGQQDVDLEYVVVDNASPDNTSELLATVDDPRLRVIRNEASDGPAAGRNTGLAAARGEWVAIVDDDDLWAPTRLASQLAELARTGRTWAFSGCVYVDGRGRVVGGVPPLDAETAARGLPDAYVVPGGISGMLWRRDQLDEGGLLDPRLTLTSDWDLALRLLRTGPPAVVASPDIGYRQHGANLSRLAGAFQDEFLVLQQKHGDLGVDGEQSGVLGHGFVASEALRIGDRRAALRAYGRALRAGDWTAITRLPAVGVPKAWHGTLRRTLLSDRGWMRQAKAWLDEHDRQALPW